jgi:hypothetical protein
MAIEISWKERNVRWIQREFHFFGIFQTSVSPPRVNTDSKWFNQTTLSHNANWLTILINVRVPHSLSISSVICLLAGKSNVHGNLSPNRAMECERFIRKIVREPVRWLFRAKHWFWYLRISISATIVMWCPQCFYIINFSPAEWMISPFPWDFYFHQSWSSWVAFRWILIWCLFAEISWQPEISHFLGVFNSKRKHNCQHSCLNTFEWNRLVCSIPALFVPFCRTITYPWIQHGNSLHQCVLIA